MPYSYQSGAIERQWLQASHDTLVRSRNGFCFYAANEKLLKRDILPWLNFSQDAFLPHRQAVCLREPTEDERPALSRFEGTARAEWIEPLHGIPRHPLFTIGKKHSFTASHGCRFPSSLPRASLFDIRYLILADHCCSASSSSGRLGQHLFFDLGTSEYGGAAGVVDGRMRNFEGVFGSRASIPLFIELYRQRCVTFDHIFAFEAAAMSHRQFWHGVPPSLRAKIRLYNTPVVEPVSEDGGTRNATAAAAASLPYHVSSVLALLLETARPADFVVLKVDIDGGPELRLVRAIAERPELAALVDELFFEYHFRAPNRMFDELWGSEKMAGGVPSVKEGGSTVVDALALMLKLRRRGVRAHFWV